MKENQSMRYIMRCNIHPRSFKERLPELCQYCRDFKIDEIMLIMNTPVFYQEEAREFADFVNFAKAPLAADGISFSIEVWYSIGGELNLGIRQRLPEVQYMVGPDGHECNDTVCPLSPAWQELTAKSFQILAETNPTSIFLADDFHFAEFNSCFCPLHLEAFNKKAGTNLTRQELIQFVLAPGKPHPFRQHWLDVCNESMKVAARRIEQAVHGVSPDIQSALMSSYPQSFVGEGVNLKELLEAFSGPNQKPLVRPCGFDYNEAPPWNLPSQAVTLRENMYCTPPGTRSWTEIDCCYTYTEFSCSADYFRSHLEAATLAGADAHTLAILHDRNPVRDWDRTFGVTLRQSKPFLNGLKKLFRLGRRERGVGLLHHERAAYTRQLPPNAQYKNLMDHPYEIAAPLQKCGIPVTFYDSDVVAVTGQVLRAFDDEKIKLFLSRGMLIDSEVAQILIDRGFGDKIGLRINGPLDPGTLMTANLEQIVHPDLPYTGEYMSNYYLTSRGKGGYVAHQPFPESTVVTRIINKNMEPVCAGMIWFENDLGGRVATLPVSASLGTALDGCDFLQWHRKELFYQTVKWLGKGEIDMFVSKVPRVWPMRIDTPKGVVLSICNISTGPLRHLDIEVGHLAGLPKELFRLSPAGQLRKIRAGTISTLSPTTVRVTLEANLPLYGLEVLVLK